MDLLLAIRSRAPILAIRGFLALTLLSAQVPPLAAQAEEGLAAFGALMVGTWDAADARNVFEWGVGRRVIKSSGYFLQDGEWVLVSEGLWYWDATERTVRGTSVAIGMPVELFQYRTRVEPNEIVHQLVTHGEMSGRYTERWRFNEDGYEWFLEQEGQRLMGGSFRRVR